MGGWAAAKIKCESVSYSLGGGEKLVRNLGKV